MLPGKYCDIKYSGNIEHWDDGLPLGNGDMGCLIWGNGQNLRLSIDKGDLWDCSGAVKPGGDFTYDSLKKLVRQKRNRKISKIFDTPYAKPTPTKLPAGKIIVKLSEKKLSSSELSLSTAEAKINAGSLMIESFVHANRCIGFIRTGKPLEFTIENPEYGDANSSKKIRLRSSITQSLKNLRYEKAEIAFKKTDGIVFQYFTQKVNEELTYGIFLASSGKEAAYTVSVARSKTDAVSNAVSLLGDAIRRGYDENFKEHKKWWENFWNESGIQLPDKYFEQKWYVTNYLLGSCSREGFAPMPLQGVWTADNGQLPPWKGDYHFDLNAQLCYSGYLKANHLSCGKSYVDFLLYHEKNAEKFARKFFNADGLCLPSVMDINADALGGWPMYALSPANQAWLCDGLKKYCDYAQDKELLENRVYPYMKKYGAFLLSILEKDKAGRLVFPLSSSPETHDNTLRSWLKPNSNYDNAMLMCHFKNLYAAAKALALKRDMDEWANVLNQLQPLAISEDNVLMLSQNERQKRSHRHFSHLIPIYPLELLKYSGKDKKIIDASVSDLEKLGTKEYCGYSFAWLANLYAIQKRGNDAAKTLKTFWNDFCLPNTFHINGDYKKTGKSMITYRIFSLEGNFFAADALQNMLMRCDANEIELFPAIPDDWKDVSFDLLASANIRVRATLKNSKLEYICLTSPQERQMKLIYRQEEIMCSLKKGENLITADMLK